MHDLIGSHRPSHNVSNQNVWTTKAFNVKNYHNFCFNMNIKAQVLANIYSPNECSTSALIQNGFISRQIQAQQK